MAFNDMKTAVLNVLRKHLLKEFLLEKKMWSNQKKKKKKKIHVFTVFTILTLQFMFLMALRQNPITAIHRVPKRKNTQLIILLRIQWHFFSKKRTKKKKKFKLLCFRIAPCGTYYAVFETMKSAIWRSSSIDWCLCASLTN